ncbi:MAG: c-type cytochrome [Scytonema sp. PMC 1069.18]|nr:c-type cytochrome [Scytonema sp. PMC 1069.18]MEC4881237.1 c-type cytochrome [Scytonema sp. PMC 1070.18]
MKKVVFMIVLAIALLINSMRSAFADEISNGAKIFKSNCASCHIAGGNILIAEKNLTKEALSEYLEDYATNSIQAIINQVQNGKNAMPSFKSKLSQQEILEVATYVFQNAERGW